MIPSAFRNAEALDRSNVNSVKYGTETITSFDVKIWKVLPNGYKELTFLSPLFYLTGHCYSRSMFVKRQAKKEMYMYLGLHALKKIRVGR